jgi:hypothetical protein
MHVHNIYFMIIRIYTYMKYVQMAVCAKNGNDNFDADILGLRTMEALLTVHVYSYSGGHLRVGEFSARVVV